MGNSLTPGDFNPGAFNPDNNSEQSNTNRSLFSKLKGRIPFFSKHQPYVANTKQIIDLDSKKSLSKTLEEIRTKIESDDSNTESDTSEGLVINDTALTYSDFLDIILQPSTMTFSEVTGNIKEGDVIKFNNDTYDVTVKVVSLPTEGDDLNATQDYEFFINDGLFEYVITIEQGELEQPIIKVPYITRLYNTIVIKSVYIEDESDYKSAELFGNYGPEEAKNDVYNVITKLDAIISADDAIQFDNKTVFDIFNGCAIHNGDIANTDLKLYTIGGFDYTGSLRCLIDGFDESNNLRIILESD